MKQKKDLTTDSQLNECKEEKMEQVKCKNCGYKWDTNSMMMSITCPNCQRKFTRPSQPENGKV